MAFIIMFIGFHIAVAAFVLSFIHFPALTAAAVIFLALQDCYVKIRRG